MKEIGHEEATHRRADHWFSAGGGQNSGPVECQGT
jgi:hypothetical protein